MRTRMGTACNQHDCSLSCTCPVSFLHPTCRSFDPQDLQGWAGVWGQSRDSCPQGAPRLCQGGDAAVLRSEGGKELGQGWGVSRAQEAGLWGAHLKPEGTGLWGKEGFVAHPGAGGVIAGNWGGEATGQGWVPERGYPGRAPDSLPTRGPAPERSVGHPQLPKPEERRCPGALLLPPARTLRLGTLGSRAPPSWPSPGPGVCHRVTGPGPWGSQLLAQWPSREGSRAYIRAREEMQGAGQALPHAHGVGQPSASFGNLGDILGSGDCGAGVPGASHPAAQDG